MSFKSSLKIEHIITRAVASLPLKKGEELLCSMISGSFASSDKMNLLILPISSVLAKDHLDITDLAGLVSALAKLISALANSSPMFFSENHIFETVFAAMSAIISAPQFNLAPNDRFEMDSHCLDLAELLKTKLANSPASLCSRYIWSA